MQAVILTGPTCSGKGQVAFELARLINGEIISLDSMKLYRGMDIGTAKPPPERRRHVRYHLIDRVDPNEEYSVGQYVREALSCAADIFSRGKRPIFAGGTPLYLWGLVRGFCAAPPGDPEVRGELEKQAEREGAPALHRRLAEVDPEAASRIHPHDRKRIVRALEVYYQTGKPFTFFWWHSAIRLPAGSYVIYGLRRPRQELYERINQRVIEMVERGLFQEAELLRKRYKVLSRTAVQCIGYREIWEGMEKGLSKEAVVRMIQRNTRRFSRKQGTWFKRFPEIRWIEAKDRTAEEIALLVARELDFGIPALPAGELI